MTGIPSPFPTEPFGEGRHATAKTIAPFHPAIAKQIVSRNVNFE